MSTIPTSPTTTDSAPIAPPPTAAPLDPRLVEETRHEIRSLIGEINQLAQSDVSFDEFCEGFLRRVVSALAAEGAAIWMLEEGQLRLQYQINFAAAQLTNDAQREARHQSLLRKVVASGQPVVLNQQSGGSDQEEFANPTDFLLVLGVVATEGAVAGVIEILQRPGGGPTTHRGYLRFLVQMCELFQHYLKNIRLRDYSDRQLLWSRLEEYIERVHVGLDSKKTCYIIANEARRLLECDRVTVALKRRRRGVVTAVSGIDTLDQRSSEVASLTELATEVLRTSEPLYYTGDASHLPPQLEKVLHRRLDISHAKALAILPLLAPLKNDQPEQDDQPADEAETLGVMMLETFGDAHAHRQLKPLAEKLAVHGGAALANALQHQRIFLLPLWTWLGKLSSIFAAGTLPKTVGAMLLIAAVAYALAAAPADFSLESRGRLTPVAESNVFAGYDGVVIDIDVRHGDAVQAGQVLAHLRNTELEVKITELVGRRTTIQEQIRTNQRALLNPRLGVDDQNRIAGEIARLKESEESLERQWRLYQETEKELLVRSPMTGVVATWRVRDTLMHRPVQRGQTLLTVFDPESPWELELRMPERRMGHVQKAASGSSEPLLVTFYLTTHPGQEYTGRIVEIAQGADLHGDEGPSVLIRVALETGDLPELRPGATVRARVHCGRRSLGYVLFHDLIETVQTRILFWL